MSDPEIEKPRVAVIAGASGLVGSHLLNALLASEAYEAVISIGRKQLPIENPKLKQAIIDFDNLNLPMPADDYFCCLGTTIGKAGSEAAFRKVDLEYPLALAKVAEKIGGNFLVVTALGADSGSRFFYNRTKGELENELSKLNLPSLHIFRPSLLTGERKEVRFGEIIAKSIAKVLPFVFLGPLSKYKPIPGSLVARAMLLAAITNSTGKCIHESDALLHGNL